MKYTKVRKTSFSLLTMLIVSMVASFMVQIINPLTAHADDLSLEQNREIRILRYYKDCLTNFVDLNGNDGNGRNEEYEGWYEVFKNSPAGSGGIPEPREVIAVGPDLDTENGVWSCEGISKLAIAIYRPSRADDYQEYLMHELWGKSYKENGGPVKVSSDAVKRRAATLVFEVDGAISRRVDDGSARRATLKRLMPFVEQCYKNWSSKQYEATGKNTELEHPEDALQYPERKLFAERQTFDWDEQKLVNIDQYNKNPKIPLEGKMAKIGEIQLGFETKGIRAGSDFNDRESDWYPLGNDLGRSIIGNEHYKNHAGQSILDCNWIKDHNDYLFTRSKSYKYYLGVDNNKLALRKYAVDDKGNEVDEVVEVSADTSTPSQTNEACGSGTGGGALRWILCPVVTAMNDAVAWAVKEVIAPALSMDPLQNGGTLYQAWVGLRNLSNVFLVLIFLLIIFANFFTSNDSSYTIKKALPRLIAAAILIQLSYFFCAALIDIGNVLGNGIGKIIVDAPGSVAGGSGASVGSTIASSLLATGGILAGGTIAILSGAWVLLLPLAIGLIISILTLLLSLGVRVIAINLLIMLSPFALLAWILPNTEKYAKMWGTNFIKLIMMYPLIIMIMAAAQVVVKVGAGSDGGAWTGVLTLFAPMIAFFMIPATFKASGTIISGVNNAIASRGKALRGATAGALNKSMRESIGKKSALTFGDKNSNKLQKTAARFGMGAATGFGVGSQAKMKRAAAVSSAFKDKKDLMHHNFEEEGISGDNAAMMAKIYDKDFVNEDGTKGRWRPEVDNFERAAIMQMISENGGVEEMSALYETLRARNGGKARSSEWSSQADKDLWNRATATSRDKLAQSLPYAVRPDGDRSLGKMDAEGITKLKSAAGKATKDKTTGSVVLQEQTVGGKKVKVGDSHIETGLLEIAKRASMSAGDIDPLDPKGEKKLTQADIDDAKTQQQKVLASAVGIGQSTDRRGRVDADNVKAIARAIDAGLLGDAEMMIGGVSYNAAAFKAKFIDEATGQLKVVPER